jgi:integrase
VPDLAQRFAEQHLPKLRPSTAVEYKAIIAQHILPALGNLKVADITYSHVDGLHRKITKGGATYRANRAVSVLSKMFALAIRWKMRPDNPAQGIERNQEVKRQRSLSIKEVLRLTKALDAHHDQQAANIIKLLLFTGARRGEVHGARWDQLDLERGVWTKPGSTTKQKTEHRAPLSAPAVAR